PAHRWTRLVDRRRSRGNARGTAATGAQQQDAETAHLHLAGRVPESCAQTKHSFRRMAPLRILQSATPDRGCWVGRLPASAAPPALVRGIGSTSTGLAPWIA